MICTECGNKITGEFFGDVASGDLLCDECNGIKEAKPSLVINVNVECPECGYFLDLINDTALKEDGWLLDKVLPKEGCWTTEHKKFNATVTCPECGIEFKAKGIDW